MLKITRGIFYCLILALISYGMNYHIAKAFIHLATLLSIINFSLAIKRNSLINIFADRSTIIITGLLIISSTITLIYFIIFNNSMSERHFSNTFYPTLLFSFILPSLKILEGDKRIILFAVVASCISMASSGIVDYIENATRRTSGVLNLPIIYASCMAILTSWASSELFKSLLQKRWIVSLFLFIAVSAGLFAILLTESRGPIISTIVVVFSLLIYFLVSLSSNNGKFYYIISITILCILTGLFLPQLKLIDNIKNRFQSGINNISANVEGEKRAPTSAGIRLDMWEASLTTILDHPITGIGPGNHKHYFLILEQEDRINVNTNILIDFNHMHNDFIQAWLDMGVIFGTLVLFFIIYPTILFARQIKNDRSSVMGVAVCVCFILCGITDVPAHNASSLYLFLLIICFQMSIYNNKVNSLERKIVEKNLRS